MANGHKEMLLQQLPLACNYKPNRICLSLPLHSPDSTSPPSFPTASPSLLCSEHSCYPRVCRAEWALQQTLQRGPSGCSVTTEESQSTSSRFTVRCEDSTSAAHCSGPESRAPCLNRTPQTPLGFRKESSKWLAIFPVCVKHPFTGKRREVKTSFPH